MFPRPTEVRYLEGYRFWLRFDDGVEGEIDLAGELGGKIFEPLLDTDLFAQLSLHPEFRTVVWPNGADLAPEFLHDRLTSRRSEVAEP
ncbi:MAG: DUF2442 domain-containing protein [Thermoanaerobaculia bacterium]|jgi:hypothetical protein|nr:DUF2442 domain-containing protein [Thermoanaerobaculia bacterium]MBP9822752.1 DUF2442 domain-containing protein [Thermoanaerobaculia bacterium]